MGIFVGYEFLWNGGALCWLGPVGDTFFGLIAYSFLSLQKQDWRWLVRATPQDYWRVGLLGLVWGWSSEIVATSLDLWQYKPGIPTLLGANYGPILELALITPLAFFLAQVFFKKNSKRLKSPTSN
ncbi:hypothetical protein HYW32_00695 [Candidatus Berkelbacteria bacterium]|nr:hypothetical protein [Candidatus Berkelbacteria bacterium]